MILYALREKESGKFLTLFKEQARYEEDMDDIVAEPRTVKSDNIYTTPDRRNVEAILDRDNYTEWADFDRPRIDFDKIGELEIVEFEMKF